uniref:At2g32160 n=1 Tax=Arabidopsis thaliana TaxID=3702 RepID=Q93XY0_ARATH|nr:Unknown protein [Arabidopsis thaliana]AAP21303.1 At2g32160 [Arabidopsis thaliana]
MSSRNHQCLSQLSQGCGRKSEKMRKIISEAVSCAQGIGNPFPYEVAEIKKVYIDEFTFHI